MRVAFALRSDAESKPGGDTKKVDHLIEALEKGYGLSCTKTFSDQELIAQKVDVVHLVNLDLPYENLRYSQVAAAAGIPVVLSTVHHPWRGIDASYKLADDRYFKFPRRIGVPADITIALREAGKLSMRSRSTRAMRQFAADPRTRDAQRRLIDASSVVLPMCESEDRELRADLGSFDTRSSIVPNGLSFSGIAADGDNRTIEAICVGRVEPRKNILELARAACAAGRELTIVGGLNERHPRYCREFISLVNRNSELTYLGRLAPPQVGALLAQSRVYINASWYEVVSQADMEAASLGCRLATTKYSYIGDFLDNQPDFIDPAEFLRPADSRELFNMTVDRSVTARIRHGVTWRDAGDMLASVYTSL